MKAAIAAPERMIISITTSLPNDAERAADSAVCRGAGNSAGVSLFKSACAVNSDRVVVNSVISVFFSLQPVPSGSSLFIFRSVSAVAKADFLFKALSSTCPLGSLCHQADPVTILLGNHSPKVCLKLNTFVQTFCHDHLIRTILDPPARPICTRPLELVFHY
jgi:hypothetical protein